MLFAIDWIRNQLTTVFSAVDSFFRVISLESIGSFLAKWPALLVLYIIGGLVLTCYGFRFYKLLSGLIGGALMGCLGWIIGVAINPAYISVGILWSVIFAVIGIFMFYIIHVVNSAGAAFIVFFAAVSRISPTNIGAIIASALFTAIFLILLVRSDITRTAIQGGAFFGLITFHYLGVTAAITLFAVLVVYGEILQRRLYIRYKKLVKKAEEFRPNAPRPPTREEIAAEMAQEEEEKRLRESNMLEFKYV